MRIAVYANDRQQGRDENGRRGRLFRLEEKSMRSTPWFRRIGVRLKALQEGQRLGELGKRSFIGLERRRMHAAPRSAHAHRMLEM